VAVTVTPGSAAPVASMTRPVTEPELVCAMVAVAASMHAIIAIATIHAWDRGLTMIFLLEETD
jgi:hypothetical protein